MSIQTAEKRIRILRHGQAIHNVQRGYPHRDPPLTEQGLAEALRASSALSKDPPELVICSPMMRTIHTALVAVPSLLPTGTASAGGDFHSDPSALQPIPKLEVWPDLREAHGAICNLGVSRAKLAAVFESQITLDLSLCSEEWDYEVHSKEEAKRRAERVRKALAQRTERDILLVTHRAFIKYLVETPRFENGEMRTCSLSSDGFLSAHP
ncbi:histidine phosphatase superfamily [Mycena amicta]|nr:histidine phosphatase superfamily [Mycena amicta]